MASELRVDRIIPVNGVPTGGGGGVIQVVQGYYSLETASNTDVYIDTGLTATITPTRSDSKILVLVHQSGLYKTADDAAHRINLRLYRDGTEISFFAGNALYTLSAIRASVGSASISHLDSPATTNAVTYKTMQNNPANNNYVYTQNNNCTSSITLMEVSG